MSRKRTGGVLLTIPAGRFLRTAAGIPSAHLRFTRELTMRMFRDRYSGTGRAGSDSPNMPLDVMRMLEAGSRRAARKALREFPGVTHEIFVQGTLFFGKA